jgi:hypothetical protein
MTRALATTLLAALLAALGCVSQAPLDAQPCPCAAGFACCDRLGMCYPHDQAALLAGSCDVPDAGAERTLDLGADLPADRPADLGPSDLGADVAPDAPLCGSGAVRARYFAGFGFDTPSALTRVEQDLSFNWGEGSPGAPLERDGWSALLGGAITPDATDDYTFFVDADDGFRLWVGGELLLDWWRTAPGYALASTVRLTAGQRYPLLVEYFEAGGLAHLGLSWKRPTSARGVIPRCVIDEAEPARSACPLTMDCAPGPLPACRGGSGLRARYYPGTTFGTPARTQEGSGIAFDWSFLSESARVTELWSVRWEGAIEAPATDEYTFSLLADASAELLIDGKRAVVVSDPLVRGEATATVALTAGQRAALRVSYTTPLGPAWAFVQLRWKSSTIAKGAIPTCFLFSAPLPPAADAGRD